MMIEKSNFEGQPENHEKGRGDYLIAWIEKRSCSDTDELMSDIDELAKKARFRITRVEIDKSPFYSRRNEIVKVYTDTYSKVPENRKGHVRDWLFKALGWTSYIIDADVNISNSAVKDKTKILQEVKMEC